MKTSKIIFLLILLLFFIWFIYMAIEETKLIKEYKIKCIETCDNLGYSYRGFNSDTRECVCSKTDLVVDMKEEEGK